MTLTDKDLDDVVAELHRLRDEVEDLRGSRDYWQRTAMALCPCCQPHQPKPGVSNILLTIPASTVTKT